MTLQKRTYAKELLDGDNIPFADIRQNMHELNVINTWLGGHAITVKGFRLLAGQSKSVHVCEIGCGGGDNLAAIVRWCNRHGISIQCTGIDIKAACIAVAEQHPLLKHNTGFITSDYSLVSFEQKPDIIFSSLFCHHFDEEQLISQVTWMKQNSGKGFFINDLHRNRIAFLSIKLLTSVFSRSYLVKHDAPLSVARGFKVAEWDNILQQAGLNDYAIQWKWAFRHLVTWRHV